MPKNRRRPFAALVALTLVAAGCSGGSDPRDGAGARPRVDESVETARAGFTVAPGVELVTVTGADADHDLTLVDDDGYELLTLTTDDLGQAHFAYVPDELVRFDTGRGDTLTAAEGAPLAPGTYSIRDETADPVQVSEPFVVLGRDDVPDESFYADQEIGSGFDYVTMRDGVQLSVNVRLPGPVEEGPYPTVIEYSGYGPSNPDAQEPGSMIAGLVGGYATVGVNMRGTGCSGGVFDVFNPAQQADGYDVVEAIARQPWVKNSKVGMVGLSYSGITQLYVASTRPPSLAAITPLSVIGDAWQMAWPGGIYNAGFTEQWLAERNRQSEAGGTDWTSARIEGGDRTCEENLEIRSQNPDFGEFTRALEDRPPDSDARDLEQLVEDIEVPVLLSGAWQDEQTGPRFGVMLDRFTGTDDEQLILFNGRHPDGYSTLVLGRWYEFLEVYVNREVPRLDPAIRAAAPAFLEGFFGVPGLELSPDRFAGLDESDLDGALEIMRATPKVHVVFESGAGDPANPGAPEGRFEADFPDWPPLGEAASWYLTADGALVEDAPVDAAADGFTVDTQAGMLTFFASDEDYQLQAPTWEFDWRPAASGASASYLTAPLADDVVIAGAGYADLWVRSDAPDADVQVAVSLVQADGTEFLVQAGQLRLSHRALAGEIGADLELPRSFAAEDRAPLEPGRWARAQVPIPSFAQAFRGGSRLRVEVSSPGRHHGTWRFDTIGDDGDVVEIGVGGDQASRIVLNALSGIDAPGGDLPCPSLRGQACR